MSTKINSALEDFLSKNTDNKVVKQTDPQTAQICDLQTGQCETIHVKDGLIERLDKTLITKDGKILLRD